MLLGDIFQAWVGLPAFETPEIRAFLEQLGRLRERGLWIGYVEGNRDFFLERDAHAEAFDVIATEVALQVGSRRILFVHGDGLNDRDYAYRFWRSLSKRRLVRTVLGVLPEAWARGFVARTERRLGSSNFKHKQRVPTEAILAYGARRFAEGHDLLVLGHFHEPLRLSAPGGEICVLDAWFRSRAVEWVA